MYIFFIHSSPDGHLGCCCVVAVVSSGGACYLFGLWFSPNVCPGVGLLDHMVDLLLVS